MAIANESLETQGAPLVSEVVRPQNVWWGLAIATVWLLVFIGAVLISAGIWVRRTFGVISVDQLLMNLPGGEGAGGSSIVVSAVLWILVVPAVTVALAMLLVEKSRRVLRREEKLNSWRGSVMRGGAAVLSAAVAVTGVMSFGATIGVDDYLESYVREVTVGTTMADFYVAPDDVPLVVSAGIDEGQPAVEEPKNLVLIYLESMENAFADDEMFERNMLAPIESATSDWQSIPSLRQYEGGGWTMAGIVATQCGIPLRGSDAGGTNTDMNNLGAEGNEVASYLEGARCLGDVLSDRGYRNVFMGGADASFAGKGTFLQTHGYEEVRDLSEWQEIGETEIREDWGLSDRRLFDHAKEEVDRLHASDGPFNLTLLTLDTHEPQHLHEYCVQDTEVALTSITECSMEQVRGFIDHMDRQGYLEDTVVVVMGDHLKMLAPESGYWEELQSVESRTIVNRIWSPEDIEFQQDDIDQFSMYPTVLDLVGALSGHRAGLGVTALAAASEVPEGSMLDLTDDEYHAVVTSRSSAFYAELWGAFDGQVEAGVK